MFAQLVSNTASLKDQMKFMVYQSLYLNIKSRLCGFEENLDFDFFTAFHLNTDEYLHEYSFLPRTYNCKSDVGFQGMFNVGNTYLVVANGSKVVLLLEPEAAMARNLPFIAILDGNYFKPYIGCAYTFWQTEMEPAAIANRQFGQFIH